MLTNIWEKLYGRRPSTKAPSSILPCFYSLPSLFIYFFVFFKSWILCFIVCRMIDSGSDQHGKINANVVSKSQFTSKDYYANIFKIYTMFLALNSLVYMLYTIVTYKLGIGKKVNIFFVMFPLILKQDLPKVL